MLALVFLAAFVLCLRLVEPEAGSWEQLLRHVLERSRVRYWLRAWSRATPRG